MLRSNVWRLLKCRRTWGLRFVRFLGRSRWYGWRLQGRWLPTVLWIESNSGTGLQQWRNEETRWVFEWSAVFINWWICYCHRLSPCIGLLLTLRVWLRMNFFCLATIFKQCTCFIFLICQFFVIPCVYNFTVSKNIKKTKVHVGLLIRSPQDLTAVMTIDERRGAINRDSGKLT